MTRETEPEPLLMAEPSDMGTKWRKTFNPEDHVSTGLVAKLVRNREKQELLAAYSNLPDPKKVKFDYWALVRLVARRLLRAGGSKTQLRPSRSLSKKLFLPIDRTRRRLTNERGSSPTFVKRL
jgi:hypothetical protein